MESPVFDSNAPHRPSGQATTQTIVPIGGYQALPATSQLYYPRGSTYHAPRTDTLWWLFVGPHGRWVFAAVNGASAVSQLRRWLQSRYWNNSASRLPSGRELGQLFDPSVPKVDRPMLLRMAYALRESMSAGEGFWFATNAMANILEQDAVNGRVSNDTALLVLLMQYHMTGPQSVFPLSGGRGERFYLRPISAGAWRPVFDTPVLPSANWEARPIVAELDQLPLSGIAAIDSKRFEQVSASGTRTAPQVVQPSSPPATATPPAQVQTTTVVTGTSTDAPIRVVDADTVSAPTTSATPGAFSQQQPPPKWGEIEILGGKPVTGGTSTAGGTGGSTTTTTGGGAGGGATGTGGGVIAPGPTTGGVNAGALAGSLTDAISPAMIAVIVVSLIAALGVVIYAFRADSRAAT
jgi:hypothetical protein